MDAVDEPPAFGRLLRRYRIEKELSQEELAEKAGLSVQAISAMERGVTQWPYRDTVARLARALELAPTEHQTLTGAARRPSPHRGPASAPATGTATGLPDETQQATLPGHLTMLIDRTADIDRIRTLLARQGTRLLTLTGPGGIGKTRLAVEAARRLHDVFPDGLFFVGLAPIQDGTLVPAAIAQALGVRETMGLSTSEASTRFIGRRTALLLLDNCEHLPDVALTVHDMLAACPQLRVLATSRTALRLGGEQVFPVAPLALPPVASDAVVSAVQDSPAVALFVERAAAVDPDFALCVDNAREVTAICRRLDGLPLAIELAAAHCGYLSPRALLARLAPSLPILTGGARDLPARQQTLRDAISWSYNLLPAEVQRVFRCLAVCVSGCTIEAAAAISTVDPADPLAIVRHLETLVRASLLVPVHRGEGDSEGTPRFAMLETIRDYGLERLVEGGEQAAVREQHLAWFLALAERAAAELRGPEQVAWLDRLEAEHDNLRAALAWSLEGGAAPDAAPEPGVVGKSSALRLAAALAGFWWAHGHMHEGRRWLAQALSAAQDAAPALRARALLGAGLLSHRQGDVQQAATLFGEGLALARTAQNLPVTVELLNNLGWSLQFQGEYHRAVALHEESLALCRMLGDTPSSVRSRVYLGWGLLQLGEYERGEESLRATRVLADQVGDTWGGGAATAMLGYSAAAQEQYGLAETLFSEALAVARRLGEKWALATVLWPLGELACRHGRLEEAGAYFLETLALFREIDEQWGIAWALEGLAATKIAARDAVEGARLLGVAARLREATGAEMRAPGSFYEWTMAAARAALGDDALAQAQAEGRLTPLRQTLDVLLA